MATFGDIRYQIAKQRPGVDLDVIDGYILDGYEFILSELGWQRREARVSIPVPAEYKTGTVSLTKGSATVTGAGTGWTADLNWRLFRAMPDEGMTFYQFIFNSATSATLDRPYEGESGTGLTYRIAQTVYRLPVDCRAVKSVDGLDRVRAAELPAGRPAHGKPQVWVSSMDAATDPPVPQIEVYPVPVEASSLMVWFDADATVGASVDTSESLLPWLRPAALKQYVLACTAIGTVSREHWELFERELQQMRRVESARTGPATLAQPLKGFRSRRLTR